ncbi:unnamed protein product [Protopolystoma xenopodis]|uniref:Uncharacterized protein n=1 Tax=Protopolystoma xenopodis TaxID=117903 RepID=A0A3S5CIE5_9PLAT|nr:unnamed protein product [Protopolystoma xenopodis]
MGAKEPLDAVSPHLSQPEETGLLHDTSPLKLLDQSTGQEAVQQEYLNDVRGLVSG